MNNKLTLPRTAWIALLASLGTISPVLGQDSTAAQSQPTIKNQVETNSQTADQIFTNADIYGHRESDSIITHKARSFSLATTHKRKLFKGIVPMSST